MTAPLYGSLPVVHGTGGLYDTIRPIDVWSSTGNGFRFDDYGANALRWAVDQAMEFYELPHEMKITQIRRVMLESEKEYSHEEVARKYIAIYEDMLTRPLVQND
jgi:starch synthase/alpha-amylase